MRRDCRSARSTASDDMGTNGTRRSPAFRRRMVDHALPLWERRIDAGHCSSTTILGSHYPSSRQVSRTGVDQVPQVAPNRPRTRTEKLAALPRLIVPVIYG